MKILYARTQFWFNIKSGGSVGHTIGVLNGFKQNQCETLVLANEHFFGIDGFEHKVVEPRIKGPPFLDQLLYNIYSKNKYRKAILKYNPDYIYHRYTGETYFVTKVAKELNIPLILEFNSFETWAIKHWHKKTNFFENFIRQYLLYNIKKLIEIYNIKKANLITVVSEPLKIDLLTLGIPEERILVNPNGIDPQKFHPSIGNSEKCKILRKMLGINYNTKVIGFSATFGPWHGVPQLTQAIDEIISKQMISDIHFLIIGDGRLRPNMEKQIGHHKNVTFSGEIPYSDIQNYLAICDILVSPHCPQIDGREFFGSPTKLFEYMAMGKGIVASNLGQIGQVLENGETAILVEPGNVNELVKGILLLSNDADLRIKLGENARNKVIKYYTWKQNVKKLIEKLSDDTK